MKNEEFKELQEFEEFKNCRCTRTGCPTSSTIDSCHLSCASLRSGSFRQLLPAKIQTVLSEQRATISPVAKVVICLISRFSWVLDGSD